MPQAARTLPTATMLIGIAAWCGVAASRVSATDPDPPQVLFGDLFAEVQNQGLYADGKAFADAVPRLPPAQILAEFHSEHPGSAVALKAFVEAHFQMPREVVAPLPSSGRPPIAAHIDALWDALTRSTPSAPAYASLLPLPAPYVVPGGRFREIYYWDSYFTMLGLDQSGRHDLVEEMVRDFAYLIDRYGHVPNGARTYYLSRSQPPFFFAMVGLLSSADPAAAFARYLPQLRREYGFWMAGEVGLRRQRNAHEPHAHRRVVLLPDGAILNRYWDDRDTPRDEAFRSDSELARDSGRDASQVYRDIRAAAESGWDFGSRWFEDGRSRATIDTTEIVPVDLNSLLFGLESAIRAGCQRLRDQGCVAQFSRRARARRAAIDRYLWDAANGRYLDYRWTRGEATARVSAAMLYPLFTGAASDAQAAAVAQSTIRALLRPGGIVTTPQDTGEQWDAPNGWAPLQWIAVAGLRGYGQSALARTVACRWMASVQSVYEQSGKLVEKYDVVTIGRSGGGGEYPTQDGFGWTNGVMRKLLALYDSCDPWPTLH